jgi:HSP90 family molecular chaperone
MIILEVTMALTLESLRAIFDPKCRGQTVLQHVPLPGIVLVRSLESLNDLQCSQRGINPLYVHAPHLLEEDTDCLEIHPESISEFISVEYSRSIDSSIDTELKNSLDASIEQRQSERDQQRQHIQDISEFIFKESEHNEAELQEYIYKLIESQFDRPELFIREAIQNADGAWEHKAENLIEIDIDDELRLITVKDCGRGMTSQELHEHFFSLYSSINEHLDYAGGTFGLGALSFFGIGARTVIIDTLPASGDGQRVVVECNTLAFLESSASTREKHGTTIIFALIVGELIGARRSILGSELDFDQKTRVLTIPDKMMPDDPKAIALKLALQFPEARRMKVFAKVSRLAGRFY